MNDRCFIVAGTYDEYKQFLKKFRKEGEKYTYVSSVECIRGLETIRGFKYGSWTYRSDIKEIEEQIMIIKTKNILAGYNANVATVDILKDRPVEEVKVNFKVYFDSLKDYKIDYNL